MNSVLKALKFRHACKKFDPNKKIPQQQFEEILECARISPSSFGMEAWKFLVIESQNLREKIKPACWNQTQITEASHVVIILSMPSLVDKNHPHVREMFNRRGLSDKAVDAYMKMYSEHLKTEVAPVMSNYAWCSKQGYIALANMMSAAAIMKIDSCPIEGFYKNQLEKTLNLNTDQEQVSVILTLGYRASEQSSQNRRPASQTVEYRR